MIELGFLVDRNPWHWLRIYPFEFPPTRENFVEILDVDKGTCDVFTLSDAFELSCLCGETGGSVEIWNFVINAGDIVDIVDRFHCNWADVVENFKVV